MQLVSRSNRTRPAHFVEPGTDDAARRLELAVDQEAHRHRRRVPAACRQSLEERFARSVFVQMERLRIEFGRKGFDTRGFDRELARAELLPGFKVLEISDHA